MGDNDSHWQRLLLVIVGTLMSCQSARAQGSIEFHFWKGGELVPAEPRPLEIIPVSSQSDLVSSPELLAPAPGSATEPAVGLTPAADPIASGTSVTTQSNTTEVVDAVEADPEEIVVEDFYLRHLQFDSHYLLETNSTTFLPGRGDDFGWFSLQLQSGLEADKHFGFVSRTAIHWMSGPSQTDIPPRVFDLVWGMQWRDEIGPLFAYDLAANFGIYADFEDSVRQGIQLPGHAVGFLRASPTCQLVFGVDYLGQDDIKLLPVFGLRLKTDSPLVDAQLVFPKPKISLVLDADHRLYTAGRIGGGSWDIERPDESNDVFTYRDHRVSIGMESLDGDDGTRNSVELGFAFNRRLTFRHDPLDMDLDQAFLIRWVSER